MKTIITIAILLIFSSFSQANDGNDNFYFRDIRLKDGLPGSTIMSITQDSLGFIWFGTNSGLCRYDGTNFKVYRHEPDNKHSISDSDIQNLYLDTKGNIWIMTINGLDFFDLEKHQITRIPSGNQRGLLADDSPTDIVETPEGTIIISSFYSGISYRDNTETSFKYINHEMSDGIRSNHISNIEFIDKDLLAIAYWDSGLEIFDWGKKQTHKMHTNAVDKIIAKKINTLQKDRNNGLWVGTTEGMYYYDTQTFNLTYYPFQRKKETFIPDNDVISLFIDQEDNIWIGTRNNGVSIAKREDILTHGENASFSHYAPSEIPGSLSYRTVLSTFQDRDGHIWIGTHGGGVNYVENRKHRFGHIKHEPGLINTLSYSKVWGLAEDKNGHIWIGTDGDGINVWSPQQGIIRRVKKDEKNRYSLSDNAIISACKDHKGQIWLGTYAGGINRYDQQENKFHHYMAPEQIPVNDIRCIYEDDEKTLWVGMNRGGIAKYNRERDVFEPIETLKEYDIRCIHKEGKHLWIGTYGNGVIKYNLQQDTSEIFTPDTAGGNSISSRTIYSICSTRDGMIWFGTRDGGLCQLDQSNGRFLTYDNRSGLANNRIHCVLSDQLGSLWLSTNNGISRFCLNSKTFINYNWAKGVQQEEFHNGSGLITSEGLICFGGIDGMNFFNPKDFPIAKKRPRISFTKLNILNQDITPSTSDVINKSIEYQPIIYLNHKHTVFSIEFQLVEFPFSEDNSFEYIMEGYDETWNLSERQNIATYRNLPAGEYVFKVRTHYQIDNTPGNESHIKVVMSPPYWKTKIAFVVYIIFIAGIIITIFKYRVNQYRIKNQLAFEQKLRTNEKRLHEERLEFFTNISHELRTPLTIIGVAMEDMATFKHTHPKLKKTIDTAVKSSNRLMELINKLMEFRKVETGVSDLTISKLNLNEYLNDYLQGFREMARHNKINLKLSMPITDLFLWVDSDKFSMILNNLLSNAFKNTPSGGQITISADEQENQIIIKVKDTGKGIPKPIQNKIFNRYFKYDNESTSTGIGLALTKSLMELHHGSIHVDSQSGKGSVFTIIFLQGNAHFTSNQLTTPPQNAVETIGRQEEVENDILLTSDQKFILVIEDNKEILDLLQEKFSHEYRVLKAQDGTEGLELARKHSPDLIISDIMMPGVSGIEVCQQLKEDSLTSHIPIILLTAKGSEEDEITGLDSGADDYISKPFKIAILQARVKALIENRIKLHHYFTQYPIDESIKKVGIAEKELTFLRMAEAYILENCLAEEISVFDLAAKLGFSRTTLYRKIKSLTGMSINGFVRWVRLKKSAELIAQGMNVSEAAYNTGFNDLKHFRESFKKLFGKNPSELK